MKLVIRLNLDSDRVRQNLRRGIGYWARLGLLSEAQVREIADKLSLLEETSASPAESAVSLDVPDALGSNVLAPNVSGTSESQAKLETADSSSGFEDFIVAQPSADFESAPSNPAKASGLSRAIQSLLSEISVIWLLFLGVFLVVVSSGVLAASQWQSFSAVGQYAVLFAYTVAFWLASLWTGKREQLQTTTRMLALATALLIPINFWMMDALSVFGGAAGVGFGLGSAIALSFIAFRLLDSKINRLNLIGTSWLHLGWAASGVGVWPVAATYLGTIGSAANLAYRDRRLGTDEVTDEVTDGSDSRETSAENTSAENASALFSFDALTLAIAILILLFRSLFIAQVPPHHLGLAAGICGWLLAWLARNKPHRLFWDFAGYGLLLLGWAMSYAQSPPWQAICVSALTLGVLWQRLKQKWETGCLLALIGVAFQAYCLLWFAPPAAARSNLLSGLAQIPRGPTDSFIWTSLGLFPFLIGLLCFARQLRQRQPRIAQQIDSVALVLGIGLALTSFGSSLTAAANLTLSTLTLIVVGRSRRSFELATLTHLAGLGAIALCIDYFVPDLSTAGWVYVALGSAIAELLGHLIIRSDRWRKNLWFGGLGLSAICYGLTVQTLMSSGKLTHLGGWLWLTIPIVLSIVANHRRALHPKAAVAASMGAFLLQTSWLFIDFPTAIAFLAIATLCTGLNSRIWRSLYSALFAIGSAISLAATVLLYGYSKFPNAEPSSFLIFWALGIGSLWFLPRLLARRESDLAAYYRTASWRWGFVLFSVFALFYTVLAGVSLQTLISGDPSLLKDSKYAIPALILLGSVLIEAIRHRPAEWRYWSLAWAVETTAVIELAEGQSSISAIAITTLVLSAIALIAGDLWVKKHPGYRFSWHGIPLVYAAIGGGLAHANFTAWTGLYTIAIALLLTAIGRRKPQLNAASYLGLLLFTTGAYELLVYRLSQASGGSPGDGATLLAALALAIALAEKWLAPWLQRYLKIPAAALQNTAHLHWGFGSLLSALALTAGLSESYGTALWTAIALLLAGYALSIGNRFWTPRPSPATHAVWTSIGLIEVLLCIAFSRFEIFFDRATVLAWATVITCAVSAIVYRLPWHRWGWPVRPFKLLSIWLPIFTVAATAIQIKIPGLLIVSAFYAWMAKTRDRIRISYLSIFLLDWAILDYLDSQSLLTDLSVALVAGLSILYVAQVDPYFQSIQQRQQRHILRILASIAIALTALYQAEVSEPMLLFAGITLVLCVGFIFAGLILKVRAFLYVGTLAFVVQIVRVLWIFISTYSLLLWAVGIVLGLMFIWIAATFESRRSQVTTLLNAWTSALDTWD